MKFQTFNDRNKMYVHLNENTECALKAMPKLKIGCGKYCGLPFDCLMTDVISGCLPQKRVCYGNCTAAQFWKEQGYDFGKRVLNNFDKEFFISCIKKLPPEQKWLRQGWISDCSFTEKSWNLTAEIASILNDYQIRLLIITKIHSLPSEKVMHNLSENKAEIRVSISALDTEEQNRKRLNFLNDYRKIGGLAVPYLMSCKYNNKILSDNQEFLVDYVIKNDFVAGEHPLRFDKQNKIIDELEKDGFWHPKFPNQYWFGRIFEDIPNFILPAPTHLKENYFLPTCFLSDLSTKSIIGLDGNLPTFKDLQQNPQQQSRGINKHAAYVIQKNQ